jgi:Tol biopolymer transport system component
VGSPSWSHDGKRIAFDAAYDSDWNKSHVFVVEFSGPSAGQVVDLGCGLIPSWSPNDEEIAFMLHPGNPNNEREGIWTMKADGSRRRRLTDGAMPAWSPQRNVIACVSGWSIPRDIFLVDVDTRAKTWLFPSGNVGSKSRLAWWPDGNHLAFAPSAPQEDELFWIVNIDRPEQTMRALGRLPKGGPPDLNWGYPTVAPDGNELVFPLFSDTARTKSLCRLRVEPGSVPVEIMLPKDSSAPGNPAWSPDGKYLAVHISKRAP